MNYLKDLKEQFTFDQLLLIFTCFSFTFPFYILGPILLIEFIYLLVSKKAIIALKQTPQIKFLYLFVLISLSISIIHKNILGALATLGIFIVIILMVYKIFHGAARTCTPPPQRPRSGFPACRAWESPPLPPSAFSRRPKVRSLRCRSPARFSPPRGR